MKLTKTAILALRGTSKEFKQLLAKELDSSYKSLQRWIGANDENGPLTKAKATEMIQKETGLEDSQILEEDTVDETQGLVKEEQN